LISHSSLGRSIVARSIDRYGLAGQVASVRIGWVSPLRIDGLQVTGEAGSAVRIQRLDVDMTAIDLITSSFGDLGQVTVRGIDVVCAMRDGRCSLEDDLASWMEPSESQTNVIATVKLEDITVAVTDQSSGATWRVSQAGADVDLTENRIQGSFAGVLTEPSGSGGSLQGSAEYLPKRSSSDQHVQWRLELNSESLPLSVVSLLRRRFPGSATSIPAQIHGDATGSVILVGTPDGAIEGSVRQLNVRNFTAADQGSRVWSNRLATLDGDLVLVGDRVIGRQLKATSDFAAAKIDGAFSRSFSLVGVNDNPLQWLEAIDGKATIEADLAAIDQSLPGMLPLREEAELVSGRVVARVDSTVNGSVRRSKLSINSDAIRARSQGRAVVIDPVEFIATVSSNGGPLRADQFQWKSAFGNAVGQGDLRSGKADIEIDFGRLTSMLRPIMHISESSLDGSIRGKIGWNASNNHTWKLSGQGSASNLVVGMPNGQTLRRQSMQGKVEAIGRWGGESLQELTRADVSLSTNGLDLNAELVQAVPNPSSNVPLPIRIVGNGRIDTLLEMLGPWLPSEIHDGAGSFRGDARAEVSTQSVRLTDASIDLTDPKIAYADRYFSQSKVKVNFGGDYSLPASDILARTLTVAGDAFSISAVGNASAEQVDMEIKWRAKLERIQGSVRPRIANRMEATVRQVGYRNDSRLRQIDIGDEQWLVMGDCEGTIDLKTRGGLLNIDTHATGTNLAIIQPQAVSMGFQTVGPTPASDDRDSGRPSQQSAKVVWSEPEVKIDGSIRYDNQTGQVNADKIQVAGDWFATTLTGSFLWNDQVGNVDLNGPARLKMSEVADRLSQLTGVGIAAEGIHETPLAIQVRRTADGDVALNVAANIGWERSEIAGLTLGEASVPVVLSETTIDIAPATIPVGTGPAQMGRINLAGQVHYRPGPLWMRLERGSGAESVRLTPEMTDKWLKYIAPVAANAARINGTVGVQLDEALIVVDQPEQSRVVGRLNIAGVEMTSGPIANQIFGGIDQLKMVARSVSSDPVDSTRERSLITMPPQTVDFVVDQGVVQHNRMFFDVDRAEVITSGQVALDGRLNMYAQIPLDARWLGSDLKGLANQPINLPIDGSLSQPSLDSSGVRQVVAELGTQAVQQTAENYLQKQLGKGIDKLFGR
jgi:translocation and assembly module TamB